MADGVGDPAGVGRVEGAVDLVVREGGERDREDSGDRHGADGDELGRARTEPDRRSAECEDGAQCGQRGRRDRQEVEVVVHERVDEEGKDETGEGGSRTTLCGRSEPEAAADRQGEADEGHDEQAEADDAG